MDRSFLKHAAVYGAGTILVQAGGFFLLPIYLRCLTPDDYGVLDVTSLLAETLGAVLLLGGFRQALFTHYQQARDEAERRRVVSAAFLLVTLAGVIGGIGLLAFGPYLAGRTLSLRLVNLAALVVLLEPFSLLPLVLLQARVESGMYVLVVIGQFLVRVALCILLVRFLRWGVAGALTASAATGALFGLALSARELSRGVPWPGLPRLKAMVAFALPLVPGGLLFFFMNQGDRFFLLHFDGKAAVGTYSLGYKLAMIARILSVTPLYMVWSSRMYAVATTPDAPRAFGQVFTRVMAAYVFVGLGLCLFAAEIVAVLGGRAYAAAVPIVAPVVLAYLLQCGATLMDAGFFIRGRMGPKLVVTVAATAVMLALYAGMIPPLGAMGAALATLGGFAALAAFTYWATQRIFVVEYEWGRLAATLGLAAALTAAGHALPAGWWGVAGKAALLLAAPALAWWTGLVSAEEKGHTQALSGCSRPGRDPRDSRRGGPPRGARPETDRSRVEVSRMDSTSFLGGIWRRGKENRRRHAPPPEAVNEDWGWVGEGAELFLRGAASSCRLFTWDGLALLLRGYARPAGSAGPLDLERVAEELRCHYLEHGELAVDELEGSFSVALCDSQAERVILYRNLIGSGFTYYLATPDGLLFAGNLAELAELSGKDLTPNRDVLPAFFLFRCVPGRETLLDDFQRLLPGEQISWDQRGLTRRQRHTFASLRGATIPRADAADLVERTLAEVLADCGAHRPGAANLLSGGVDSSCLQAIWNVAVHRGDDLPASYSVCVDHPMTWPDADYAVTASQALGTRHVLVPADGAYSAYLLDALAATAEPLNHVQSAYFGHLARAMRRDGVPAGLCGEGADSLFGLSLANQVHNARVLRRLLPARALRGAAGVVAEALGWPRLAHVCRFADRLGDPSWLVHPINQVASFTDVEAVEACFGGAAVARAAEDRRRLLDLFAVPDDPLERMHAVGLLGEAMDSAGLWATLFHRAGADLLCPFLDSRVLRLALSLAPEARFRFRRPKDLLKRTLARRAGPKLATRAKLGFGQPIFEWLAPGGQLRPLVERLGEHAFVDPAALARLRRKPTWFLYSLLVYDAWHKLFIDRSLPRPQIPTPARHQVAVSVGSV